MSADNGVVVPLMRGCHCIWGLPRRAVHSLCIADGTVSATRANFGANARVNCHSTSQRVEPQLIFWRTSETNARRPLRLPRHAAPSLHPREAVPDPPFFSAVLARTSSSPRRASTPCSSRTSYGVTRHVARRDACACASSADLLSRRPTVAHRDARPWPRGSSRTIALPLALTLGQFFYVPLIFVCFRFFLLPTTGASPS